MSDFTCSVGLGGAIDKNGAARHDLLPRGQAGENLEPSRRPSVIKWLQRSEPALTSVYLWSVCKPPISEL